MAHGDIDLCIQHKGEWSIGAIYPAAQKQKALADAKKLAADKAYDAIILIVDDTRQVLFSYAQKGPTPTYSVVAKGLKNAAGKPKPPARPSGALENLYAHRRDKTNEAPPSEMPQVAFSTALMVGAGGFCLTALAAIFMAVNGASLPSVLMILMMLGSVTIAAAMWVHSVFDEAGPNKAEAQQQLEWKKKLKKTEQLFAEAYTLGKAIAWDADAAQFKQDGHFGLILYMLGMSGGFHQTLGLDLQATNRQIATLLAEAHIAPESIFNCATNLHEYLAYPRYHAMFHAGKDNILEMTRGQTNKLLISDALQQWFNNGETTATPIAHTTDAPPLEKPLVPQTNFAVVGFTDVVNFTESVRTMGDEWMVDVLQAHNSIVREAIGSFGGYEVKHTGDGIMMSFPTAEQGLKACISIQKGIKIFNEKMPARQFAVRMGISAGEPIHMDGDLFGQPVNLAARIMPFAATNQIAVSDTLHQMAEGMGYNFTNKDDCILKGFDGPQTIYFLEWDIPTKQSEPAEPQTP